MPLQATSGAASYDAFGGGVPVVPVYIEDVMSTWLYTGTGATQTITNGIDLSTKGGLVWLKNRTYAGTSNTLYDTSRGINKSLESNTTGAQVTGTNELTAFNANGFTLGSSSTTNWNTYPYASWTFRKQPKFFDVVTYTGTGSSRTIAHNLGSAVGCVIVKRTDSANDWIVWHRSGTQNNNQAAILNATDSYSTIGTGLWGAGGGTPDMNSSTISIGGNTNVNAVGGTYVAYVFAHNAGGFGLTGTDNVISCGTFTTDGSGKFTANIGYEPQWIMIKLVNGTSNWSIFDNMRGMPVGSQTTRLLPNTSGAESSDFSFVDINATGFAAGTGSGNPYGTDATFIYIAIRRGPMKVPTSGTSVFYPNAYSGTGTDTTITSTGFPPDLFFSKARSFDSLYLNVMVDRLRGASQFLVPTNTIAETEGTNVVLSLNMNGVTLGGSSNANSGTVTYAQWNFRRAPSFFDEVCYTGTGGATTIAHNLQAVPQLILVKQRTASPVGSPFTVYSATLGNTGVLFLNSDGGNQGPDSQWNSTTPTSSVFSLGSSLEVNQSGSTFVAYLFATCAGVSKVGSYTGTGTTLQIDCGFTSGARFVLIKRSGTGGWYVWDSARGIVSGDDPYLLLNSTAAEVTNTDYIDTYSAGFEISSTAPAAINASGGTFIFLAIA